MDQFSPAPPAQTDRIRPGRDDDDIWQSLFSGFAREGISLQARIRQTIVRAIEARQLPALARMPSGRQLAGILGIARNTVVLAYQQLVDEGFLEARERSGYYVAPYGTSRTHDSGEEKGRLDWAQRFCLQPSRQRNIVKPRDWLRYPFPFIYGQFDPSLFPTNNWRECARSALSVLEIQNWARDMIDGDDPELIDQIRLHILPRRGIWASTGEIMITLGAQQGLSLAAQLLVRKEDTVGVEDPGYPDARNIFSLASDTVIPLAVDDEGLVLSPDLQRCNLVFATLGHQCPTGVTMPQVRRTELMALAQREDILIIEDDYEADMLPESDEHRALKSHDREGRVIYLGSLSKTLAPGLRLGFVVAAEPVIRELRALRRLSVRHPPTNNQRAAALFLSLGHYRAHVNRIGQSFSRRAGVARSTLSALAPGLSVEGARGSSSLWVKGEAWLDASALAKLAEARGVLIEAGDIFFARSEAPRNAFRLGLSSIPENRIPAGIETLAACVEQMRPR